MGNRQPLRRYLAVWTDAEWAERAMAVMFAGYWLTLLYVALFAPTWNTGVIIGGLVFVCAAGLWWSSRCWRHRRALAHRLAEVGRAVEAAGGWQRLQPEHRERIERVVVDAERIRFQHRNADDAAVF